MVYTAFQMKPYVTCQILVRLKILETTLLFHKFIALISLISSNYLHFTGGTVLLPCPLGDWAADLGTACVSKQ